MCVFQRGGSTRTSVRRGAAEHLLPIVADEGSGRILRFLLFLSFLLCFVLPRFRRPFVISFPFFSCNCAIFYDCPFFLSISLEALLLFLSWLSPKLPKHSIVLSFFLRQTLSLSKDILCSSSQQERKKERKRETERLGGTYYYFFFFY